LECAAPAALWTISIRFCLGLFLWLCLLPLASAQQRPYIGFVYPAGGQQGTTVQIRLGGQGLDGVQSVLVTGTGVSAKVVEYYRRFSNEELRLVNEQLALLRREGISDTDLDEVVMAQKPLMASDNADMDAEKPAAKAAAKVNSDAAQQWIDKIEKRTSEHVVNPDCPSIASLVMVEVTIAPNADPGDREIRLVTLKGVSNPLGFYVGQLPEVSRKPMRTASLQVLGKEAQALRQRLPGDIEDEVKLPCTLNGQIASGEVNRYRFEARRGQQLVMVTHARQLVPFIADAVPGWFQPVLTLYDAQGKEVAYADDYRFQPDPVMLYSVPKDGQYVLEVRDGLYRGREDFVYRISLGELPFITSVFPPGCPAKTPLSPELKGWNLKGAEPVRLPPGAEPGIHRLTVARKGMVSNPVPFALDELPETLEQEPNPAPANAQKLTLPVILNGRIGARDDWDVFQFAGRSNDLVAVEVWARRLDSPLDSVIKLTDSAGHLLALNDDYEDLASGINTHHADSRLLVRLPQTGTFYVHLGDTARQGGEEYVYRLRLSAPQPDFDLRVVPSSVSLRSNSTATLTVYAQRRDGFAGSIKLALKDPPPGFSATPVTLTGTQMVARLNLKAKLISTPEPVSLSLVGTVKTDGRDVQRLALPAEDQMQAFLWRHLVPAKDLKALVFDPAYQPPNKRPLPARAAPVPPTNAPVIVAAVPATNSPAGSTNAVPASPKFTPQQVAGRLRQLKQLYEEGMLTDSFYLEKVAECEAAQ
jgi:hypothetical protein